MEEFWISLGSIFVNFIFGERLSDFSEKYGLVKFITSESLLNIYQYDLFVYEIFSLLEN